MKILCLTINETAYGYHGLVDLKALVDTSFGKWQYKDIMIAVDVLN